MADSSITSVQNRNDGNMYYVIGGDSSEAAKHIVKVDTIAERNALSKVTGFVLVRNAYKDDPTVNRGWAIYIADGTTTTTTNRTWIKVIEEESVEGSWGNLAELLVEPLQTTWRRLSAVMEKLPPRKLTPSEQTPLPHSLRA